MKEPACFFMSLDGCLQLRSKPESVKFIIAEDGGHHQGA